MSDSKKRVSASVDPDVARYLQQTSVNASGLINKLVKKHQTAGGTQQAMLELRRDQLQSELNDLENSVEVKENELQQVEQKLNELRQERKGAVDEAAEKLKPNDFEMDTMKVNFWMDETGLDRAELEAAVQERWRDTT